MKTKTIKAAMLSLALVPCLCLFACSDKNGGNNNENGNAEAAQKLESQIKAADNTYKGIYNRAERCGGLFAESTQKSAVKFAYAEEGDDVAVSTTDTSALIEKLYKTVQEGNKTPFPNPYALETYAIDLFAYTQISQAIVKTKGKLALTEIYKVDYEVNSEVYENLTTGFWSTKIPEEMNFAGFDENSKKINITFKARTPSDKENNFDKFEKVNSEMYYISDNDFGYAQFTYRYDNSGNLRETGFDFFSMKDKSMLEINMSPNQVINNVSYNGMPAFTGMSAETILNKKSDIIKYFYQLESIFTERTYVLEQQNLALAVEAGVDGIESVNDDSTDGKTKYVKKISEDAFFADFDYEILEKMK